jgi:hypothetical protein
LKNGENRRSVHNETTHGYKLILVSLVLVNDEKIRPQTDPSVSDLGTGLGSSSSNKLISARLSCQDSFAFSSLILSFQLYQLIETPFGSVPDFGIQHQVSSIEYRLNLNKGRD